jgi:hypothetical protein
MKLLRFVTATAMFEYSCTEIKCQLSDSANVG